MPPPALVMPTSQRAFRPAVTPPSTRGSFDASCLLCSPFSTSSKHQARLRLPAASAVPPSPAVGEALARNERGRGSRDGSTARRSFAARALASEKGGVREWRGKRRVRREVEHAGEGGDERCNVPGMGERGEEAREWGHKGLAAMDEWGAYMSSDDEVASEDEECSMDYYHGAMEAWEDWRSRRDQQADVEWEAGNDDDDMSKESDRDDGSDENLRGRGSESPLDRKRLSLALALLRAGGSGRKGGSGGGMMRMASSSGNHPFLSQHAQRRNASSSSTRSSSGSANGGVHASGGASPAGTLPSFAAHRDGQAGAGVSNLSSGGSSGGRSASRSGVAANQDDSSSVRVSGGSAVVGEREGEGERGWEAELGFDGVWPLDEPESGAMQMKEPSPPSPAAMAIVRDELQASLQGEGLPAFDSALLASLLPRSQQQLYLAAQRSAWRAASLQLTAACAADLASAVRDCLHAQGLPRVAVLLRNLGIEPPAIARLIDRRRVSLSDLVAKLQFLQSLGVRPRDLHRVLRDCPPAILDLPLSRLQMHTQHLLLHCVRGVDLGRVIEVYPPLLSLRVHRRVEAHCRFLLRLGVDPPGLHRMVRMYPKLLGCSLRDNIVPTLQFLAASLPSLSHKHLAKLITKCPFVLGSSIETKLRPTLDFLRLHVPDATHLAALVKSQPQILLLSPDRKLQPMLLFLSAQLALSPSQLSQLIRRHAAVLCSSPLTISRNVAHLHSLGFSTFQISSMAALFPTVLLLKPETMKAKFDFLVDHMYLTAEDVVSFPHYFGYSLERRIQPRFERIRELGVSSSLASMLCCSNEVFEERWPAPIAVMDGGSSEGRGGGRVKGARARVAKESSNV